VSGGVEDKPTPHRVQLPDVYVLHWIALVRTVTIRMDKLV